MKIGFIFAMPEEAVVLNSLFDSPIKVYNYLNYEIAEYTYKDFNIVSIISGIGKAFAASATTLLIEKYKVDLVINIGSAGGVNSKVGDLIVSNTALYHDVDVTAAGYIKGALPKQPLTFVSTNKIFNLDLILTKVTKKDGVYLGTVATGDQFINDINMVNRIKTNYHNIKAIEMEAAAIAQICYNSNVEFLLVKKISDLADSKASETFKKEIINFNKKVVVLIKELLINLNPYNHN